MKHNFTYAILVILFTYVTSAFAGVTKTFDFNRSGTSTISVCSPSFQINSSFKVKVGPNGIEQGGRVNSNNCAVKTYTSGVIEETSEIYFTVMNQEYVVSKSNSGGGGNRPTPTPYIPPNYPTPTPYYPSPTPTPMPLPRYNVGQAQREGAAAAEEFINYMLQGYGVIEAIRFNLYEGVLASRRSFERVAQGDVAALPSYRSSYDRSKPIGRNDGFSAGQSHGSQKAVTDVVSRVESQFLQAVDSGRMPQSNDTPLDTSFDGLNGNKQVYRDLNDRLYSETSYVISRVDHRLNKNRCLNIQPSRYNDYFDLAKIASWGRYDNDVLLRSFRGQNALTAWYNRTISNCSNYVSVYERINEYNYSNSEYARQVFRDEFLRVYNSEIDRDWLNVTERIYPDVKELAEKLYWDSLVDYASELGGAAGYNAEYNISSRDGFQSTYLVTYKKNYPIIFDLQTNRSDIRYIKIKLEDIHGSFANYPGQILNLIVDNITNLGGKAEKVVVQFSTTSNYAQVTKDPVEFEVPAISKLTSKDNLVFERVAQLANQMPSGANGIVQVKIGKHLQDFSFKVSFQSIVETAAVNKDLGLLNIILRELQKDWEANAGAFSPYFDMREIDTKIESFLDIYDSLPSPSKDFYKQNKLKLRNIIPSTRPGFFSGQRGDWDGVVSIMKARGLY